jgi:hypothetical protein
MPANNPGDLLKCRFEFLQAYGLSQYLGCSQTLGRLHFGRGRRSRQNDNRDICQSFLRSDPPHQFDSRLARHANIRENCRWEWIFDSARVDPSPAQIGPGFARVAADKAGAAVQDVIKSSADEKGIIGIILHDEQMTRVTSLSTQTP